jgi:hypothetical protein
VARSSIPGGTRSKRLSTKPTTARTATSAHR